jgi:hypothetical protein
LRPRSPDRGRFFRWSTLAKTARWSRSCGTPLDIVRNDLPPALAKMERLRIEYVAPRQG